MKKIFAAFLVSALLVSTSFANSKNEENRLYKAIILSRDKISKDFSKWDLYNRAIKKYFDELRISKDKKKMDDLESRLNKAIKFYSNKSLNINERKDYNIILNISYRLELLRKYILKWNYSSNNIINNDNRLINENNSIKNDNKNNNSIADLISDSNKINNTRSLSYNFYIPKWWEKYKEWNGKTVVINKKANYEDSISFIITDYDNYHSFYKFYEEFKKELLKSYNRNFSYINTSLDWKNAYLFKFDNQDWDEKTIYIAEHNKMVLVVNATKKKNNSSSSNREISEIIESLKINN